MTEPTVEQLLHLVDRAIDGRILPAEAVRLRAGVAEVAELHADLAHRDATIRHLDAGLSHERARASQAEQRLLMAARVAADERDRAYAAEQRVEQAEAERDGAYRERVCLARHCGPACTEAHTYVGRCEGAPAAETTED